MKWIRIIYITWICTVYYYTSVGVCCVCFGLRIRAPILNFPVRCKTDAPRHFWTEDPKLIVQIVGIRRMLQDSGTSTFRFDERCQNILETNILAHFSESESSILEYKPTTTWWICMLYIWSRQVCNFTNYVPGMPCPPTNIATNKKSRN